MSRSSCSASPPTARSSSTTSTLLDSTDDPDAFCFEEGRGHHRLGEFLSSRDVPYVKLLADFRSAVRDQGQTLFRKADRHWNAAGHGLAAREVLAALERD